MKTRLFTIAALLFAAALTGLQKANAQWQLAGNTLSAPKKLGTLNGYPVQIYTNGTEKMRVDVGGYVGIGTTTPAYKLDVAGDINIGTNLYQNGQRVFATNTALFNTIAGVSAGYNSTGNSNSMFGFLTGLHNGTGQGNSFFGYIAGNLNDKGSGNSYFGNATGDFNTSGSYNTLVGYASGEGGSGTVLYNNNALLGAFSGQGLVNASNNAALGYQSLMNTSSGSNNTAAGYQSLYSNLTGYSNVAIGTGSLFRNRGGHNLVAVGDSALYNNDNTLGYNTALGSKAMYNTTTGSGNTASGMAALYNNVTGNYNTAEGYLALYYNTSGYYNAAGGYAALYGNSTGYANTAYGFEALLNNTTGYDNTAIGYLANVNANNLLNATAIGANALVNASNKVVIGSNTPKMVIGGYAPWSNFSDGRFKENIKENVPGLQFITKLRPVTYTINTQKLDNFLMQNMPDSIKSKRRQTAEAYASAASKIQTGLIAQEVEKTAKELGYDFDGVNTPKNSTDNYSIAYSQLIMPLIKAVQELAAKNDSLQAQVNELKTIMAQGNSTSLRAATLTDAAVEQNNPNPFANNTTINYTLPLKYSSAQIVITDKGGKTLKQINISGSGAGSVKIDASNLSIGVYSYALMVDGRIISTRQMAVVR